MAVGEEDLEHLKELRDEGTEVRDSEGRGCGLKEEGGGVESCVPGREERYVPWSEAPGRQ